jgi:integrase/recombinase XerD
MPSNALISRPQPLVPVATSAVDDWALLASWVERLASPHSRSNFAKTGERFLQALEANGTSLRSATVEHVSAALAEVTHSLAPSSARQYVLRCKSLLSYAAKVGYTPFNVGAVIKPGREVRALSKRIVGELDVHKLIDQSRSDRDFLLMAVAYCGGLRVSELVGLNVGDVIAQDSGRVQLHVLGKGQREREVLLPADLGPELVGFCAGRPPEAPLFTSRKLGRRLSRQAVHRLVKRLAGRTSVTKRISPHWLRHAHASHALDHGESLAVVAATLGHENVKTTSAYLHAKPGAASGDKLDPGIWKRGR